MDVNGLLWVAFLTLLPGLELRLSIPAGILASTVNLPLGYSLTGLGLPILEVFVVAVLTNIILGPIVFYALHQFISFFLKFSPIKRCYEFSVKRTQKKVFPLVEKFGIIGIALFIAIPLPGSGSYTGALAAYLLGMESKQFAIANIVGVLIAGIVVTGLTIGAISFL